MFAALLCHLDAFTRVHGFKHAIFDALEACGKQASGYEKETFITMVVLRKWGNKVHKDWHHRTTLAQATEVVRADDATVAFAGSSSTQAFSTAVAGLSDKVDGLENMVAAQTSQMQQQSVLIRGLEGAVTTLTTALTSALQTISTFRQGSPNKRGTHQHLLYTTIHHYYLLLLFYLPLLTIIDQYSSLLIII